MVQETIKITVNKDNITKFAKFMLQNNLPEEYLNLIKNPDYDLQSNIYEDFKIACTAQLVSVVETLLHDNINPEFDNNYCLLKCCEIGNVELVKLLLSNNRVNSGDLTSSFVNAINHSNIEVANLFLDKLCFKPNNQCLFQSCMLNSAEIVKKLLVYDIEYDLQPCLTQPIIKDNVEIVEALIADKRFNLAYNNKMLLLCMQYKRIDILKLLINHPQATKEIKEYCLTHMCKYNLDIEILLNEHIDFSTDSNAPIKHAIRYANKYIIKQLLHKINVTDVVKNELTKYTKKELIYPEKKDKIIATIKKYSKQNNNKQMILAMKLARDGLSDEQVISVLNLVNSK